jgi:hypothetical protein
MGVFTDILQNWSRGLKPEPVTVTKNVGPTWLGETETVGEVTVKVFSVVAPVIVPVTVIV